MAQRLTRIILPANSERLTVLPARSANEMAGAGSGGVTGMNSPSRTRSVTPGLSLAAEPARHHRQQHQRRSGAPPSHRLILSAQLGSQRMTGAKNARGSCSERPAEFAVGRSLYRRPGGDHAPHQCLDRFRQAPLCRGYPRVEGALRDARRAEHPVGGRWRGDRRRSRPNQIGDRKRQLRLQRRARGHPHEHRGAPCRADRAGGGTPAHRALAQRPGRDRFAALGARRDRPTRWRQCASCSRR